MSASKYGRLFHFLFEWDRATGFSCDLVNYGPIDVTFSSWIVPNTISKEEPDIEEKEEDGE